MLVSALRALRAQPGVPAPEFLVVSGELTSAAPPAASPVAPSAATAPDTTTARPDSTRPPRTNAARADSTRTSTHADSPGAATSAATNDSAAYAALGRDLAQGPAAAVFLAARDTVPATALTAMRDAADTAGVRVYDLAACSGSSAEPCDVGTRYRLVAIPPLPKDTARARAVVDTADSLVSRAEREQRRVILVPYDLPGTDVASQKTAAAWTNLTGRDGVAAVLVRRASGAGVAPPAAKFVDTPPLGAPGSGPTAATRGASLVTLRAGAPEVETLLYDRAFRRLAVPSAPAPPRRRGAWAHFAALGESLGEPARTALFCIAGLAAFLTVAALWRPPVTVIEQTTTAPLTPAPAGTGGGGAGDGATPVAAGTAAGAATTTRVTTGDDGGTSVFQSNLGRTVVSGLTGIAAVTVLKDVWGISGFAGQALFAAVFVAGFGCFLIASAVLRGVIEAFRDRVAAGSYFVDTVGVRVSLWRRFVLWLRSYRTTILVFLDTASSVIFGHAPAQILVWAARYTELQGTLLACTDRVREQVSDGIGNALREAGNLDARSERDYRVNVSLLSRDGQQAFYISAARGALRRVFGAKSVAYVAISAGEARWWKKSYEGGHRILRTAARLRTANGAVPAASTTVADLVGTVAAGTPVPGPTFAVQVSGTRGDGSALPPAGGAVDTVGALLAFLNGPDAFGGGSRPAVASLDAGGYLLLADNLADGAADGVARNSQLAVTTLKVGALELGPFQSVTAGDIILFHNVPEVFAGAGTNLPLDTYLESRGPLDYEAFMLIPIPFAPRGLTPGARRAAIHISFRRAADLNALWPALDRIIAGPTPTGGQPVDQLVPAYDAQGSVLRRPMLADPVLEGVLAEAVRVLGELVQPMNDDWYWGQARR